MWRRACSSSPARSLPRAALIVAALVLRKHSASSYPAARKRPGKNRPLASANDLGGALLPRLFTLTRLPKPNGLRQLRPGFRIVRRDHRVVQRQRPLLPILRWGQAPRGEVALQGLVWASILHADQMIGGDRLPDRNRRLQHHLLGLLRSISGISQRRMDGRNEAREIGLRD